MSSAVLITLLVFNASFSTNGTSLCDDRFLELLTRGSTRPRGRVSEWRNPPPPPPLSLYLQLPA